MIANDGTVKTPQKRAVISYPLKTRVINRLREWESQFWLLVMSAVVMVYMALTGLKARIKGQKTGLAESDGTKTDRQTY